ncbi:MAG: MBOAT family O-acyltransferase, partial [Candidatus Nanopelagicales bacterium]
PYSATSITDFWRRWHMSLSRWFRDYVYVPMGGNRASGFNTYRNLIAVFLLTGIWHGANWTFVVWGAYHGLLLVIERATGLRKRESTGLEVVARRAVTALLVIVGWVFFRAPDLPHAFGYLKAMFVINGNATPDAIVATLTDDRIVVLGLALLVFAMPMSLVMGKFIERQQYLPATAFKYAIIGVAAPIAALAIASGTFSPFLYFQF